MTAYHTLLKWSAEHGGSWMLHIAHDLDLSPLTVRWAGLVWPPPSLVDRYDALERLGYAVVEGGAGAWTWEEAIDPDGEFFLSARTEVRPLILADPARF